MSFQLVGVDRRSTLRAYVQGPTVHSNNLNVNTLVGPGTITNYNPITLYNYVDARPPAAPVLPALGIRRDPSPSTVMSHRFLVFLPFLLPPLFAAITQYGIDSFRRDCVVQTDAGTLYSEPRDSGIVPEECVEGRYSVYHDDKGCLICAATWPISPARVRPVFISITGRRLDNSNHYHAVRRDSHGDSGMSFAVVHANECVLDQNLPNVSDGDFSLDNLADTEDDNKEWWGWIVLNALAWTLGSVALTLQINIWGLKAARVIQACRSMRFRTASGGLAARY